MFFLFYYYHLINMHIFIGFGFEVVLRKGFVSYCGSSQLGDVLHRRNSWRIVASSFGFV
jgi:hypothetical protein